MARLLRNGIAFGSLLISIHLFVPPAFGQVTFVARASYPTGQNPQYVAVGDVSGDGAPDVVIANTSSNNISVLINKHDGAGGLNPPVAYPVGVSPSWVAIADLDNDANPDIIVTNTSSGSLSVLLGNGGGTFKTATSFAVLPSGVAGTPSPSSVAVGDVNKDGCLDAVVANAGLARVSVMLGDGRGTLTASATFAVGKSPNSIALTQCTTGPNLDIVTCNKTDKNVSVLLGNGDGTFQVAKNTAAGYVPFSVQPRDYDGDGITDVIVTDNMALASGINFLKGNGDGTFRKAVLFAGGKSPIGAAVGDFNKDGRPDIAIVNTGTQDVTVFLNLGSTFGAPIALAPGTYHLGAGVGDFDGDGTDDITLANSPSGVTVLVNVTASLTNFLIAPNTLLTGGSTQAKVTLSRPAPAGGVLITLVNDSPLVAWIPANLTIPAGDSTASFRVSTMAPNAGRVTITASYSGVSFPATLTVNPAPLGPLKADINGDGKVDLLDLASLARIVAGVDVMK